MACPSSPLKRAKLSAFAPIAASASAVTAHEPALLELIVSYLPGTNKGNNSVSTMLHTIVSLCRAVPGLGSRLSPANESFWRALVLSQFDFTVDADNTFNVEDQGYTDAMSIESMKKEAGGWWRHPARSAIRQWQKENGEDSSPGDFLAYNLTFWSNIGAYFRPKEYGFLSKIQSGKESMSSWPAEQDAFTLYCDLVIVVEQMATLCCQTDDYKDLYTSSDGFAPVYPVFMSRLDAPLTTRGFALLRHLEILPHFWWRAPSARWSGFDGPQPLGAAKIKAVNNKDDEEEEEEEESDYMDCRIGDEDEVLPRTQSRRVFESLMRTVYDSFCDWRTVYVNYSEHAGPQFCVGPTKRSGRWIGFVGQRQYY